MMYLNIDWLNENTFRNYPIVDGASRKSFDGNVLPNSLIVDIHITAPFDKYSSSSFFIQRVEGFNAGVKITIAALENPQQSLASAVAFVKEHYQYKSYLLYGLPDTPMEGFFGRIILGTLDAVVQCSKNTVFDFVFSPANTAIVVSCVKLSTAPVQQVSIVNEDGKEIFITSPHVRFIAGKNTNLDVDPETGNIVISSNLTITAADALQNTNICDRDLLASLSAPVVKTINGIPPDETGNITIEFSGALGSLLGGAAEGSGSGGSGSGSGESGGSGSGGSGSGSGGSGSGSGGSGSGSGGSGSFSGGYGLGPPSLYQNAIRNGLVLVGSYSSPCCGPDVINNQYENINRLETMKAQLMTAIDQLQTKITNLISIILASGINPPSGTTKAKVDTWIYNDKDQIIIPI